MKANILVVDQCNLENDGMVRTRKIARAIESHGYDVGFIGIDKGLYKIDGAMYPVDDGFDLPVFFWPMPFNLFFAYRIYRLSLKMNAGLIVAKSLKVFFPVWVAARALGIPVVFDMAEYFRGHGQLVERSFWEGLIKFPAFVGFLERTAVRLADAVWVVVQEQRDRFIDIPGSDEKVSVVSNTPEINNLEDIAGAGREAAGPLRLIYVGYIVEGRGIQLILNAISLLPPEANVEFWVVGYGVYLDKCRALAEDLKLGHKVVFKGRVPPEEVSAYLALCDVGVIPHKVCNFWNHTIPNKLFDYMLMSMPVMSTPNGPIMNVIEGEKCGVIVPEDPEEVASSILWLEDNRGAVEEMGRRGREAVLKRYNWTEDSKIILDTIRRLS